MRNMIPPNAIKSGGKPAAQRKPCAKCQKIRETTAAIAARIRAALGR